MKNAETSEIELGAALRQFRIRRGYSLEEVADRAGLSPTSVRSLELGRGSTVSTMLKVLAAIDEIGIVDEWMARSRRFSPMAAFKAARGASSTPQRVGRARGMRAASDGV
ncbi:MAG: helix-turn-helix domain-containing protein [Clostridiales Family XIII bacterium]|jgi:transcriptional regulator with XRE-family HTH domain|nr:helix-turn-helix domain-containing protein [Clostridiales Family XIII bacterium]